MGEKLIAWPSNISKSDTETAGILGSNLGEIYKLKIPTQPSFIITTQAIQTILEQNNLEQKIQNTLQTEESSQIKSQKIQSLILQAPVPASLQKEILEAYDHLNINLDKLQTSPNALAILKSAREPVFISITTSQIKTTKSKSITNIKGNQELLQNIKQNLASIFTPELLQNQENQNSYGIPKTAIIIQKINASDKSGIIFSQNQDEQILIKSVFGQLQGIYSEQICPDEYFLTKNFEITEEEISNKEFEITRTSSGKTKLVQLKPEKSTKRTLKIHEIKQLAEYAIQLEKHFKYPQEITFSIDDHAIYILQTKNVESETIPQQPQQILPVLKTKTKLKLSIDSPEQIKKALQTSIQEAGIIKLEKIISNAKKHPLLYKTQNDLNEYKHLLKTELTKIIHAFPEKPTWIRLSNIQSNKYPNLEGSPKNPQNPLLEDNATRFLLKHPEILKTELLAIKEAAQSQNTGILLPKITSPEEIKQIQKYLQELQITNIKLGISIDTPASCILIKDICQTKIDFISFNLQSLTKYTLATYQENHTSWAVLKQISRVIRECKSNQIKTSIHNLKHPNENLIRFLLKCQIDSITLPIKTAYETSKLLQELEAQSQIEPIGNKQEIKKELKQLEHLEKETKKEDIFK